MSFHAYRMRSRKWEAGVYYSVFVCMDSERIDDDWPFEGLDRFEIEIWMLSGDSCHGSDLGYRLMLEKRDLFAAVL